MPWHLFRLEFFTGKYRHEVAKSKNITAAGIASLQAALPQCNIIWDDPAKAKTPATPITDFNSPAFQQWMKDAAALPAEKQVDAVAKKLVELNPGFDGKERQKIEGDVVRELEFLTDHVTDISPLRALTGLHTLRCNASGEGKGKLSDLSPLNGMRLTWFECWGTPISDLSPLK